MHTWICFSKIHHCLKCVQLARRHAYINTYINPYIRALTHTTHTQVTHKSSSPKPKAGSPSESYQNFSKVSH